MCKRLSKTGSKKKNYQTFYPIGWFPKDILRISKHGWVHQWSKIIV